MPLVKQRIKFSYNIATIPTKKRLYSVFAMTAQWLYNSLWGAAGVKIPGNAYMGKVHSKRSRSIITSSHSEREEDA
jgi:hypothetical protein